MKRYRERCDHAGHLFETDNGDWVKFEDVKQAINDRAEEIMNYIHDAYREGEQAERNGWHWDESVAKVRFTKINEEVNK